MRVTYDGVLIIQSEFGDAWAKTQNNAHSPIILIEEGNGHTVVIDYMPVGDDEVSLLVYERRIGAPLIVHRPQLVKSVEVPFIITAELCRANILCRVTAAEREYEWGAHREIARLEEATGLSLPLLREALKKSVRDTRIG